MNKDGTQVKIVHMIGEVVKFTRKYYPGVRKVGILATKGTIYSDVYTHHFHSEGIRVIYPDKIFQDTVHSAIYDSNFGIKAFSNPVKKIACAKVRKAIGNLIDKGVESIVLGCTELPLAIEVDEIHGIPILDSSLILARALIEKVAPKKLKPFQSSPDLA